MKVNFDKAAIFSCLFLLVLLSLNDVIENNEPIPKRIKEYSLIVNDSTSPFYYTSFF